MRFYCKDVWRRIEDESFQRYQNSLMLQPYPERLKPNEVKNVLRFMPKGDATRPITRSIRTSAKDRVFARVATQLKETNGLLDYICRSALASKSRVPLTGAGIRGGNFCKPFKKFATRYWKGERPKIYVVKSDIRECFDSINHNKLREVLRSMINENRYETTNWKSRRIRRPKSQRKIEKQRRKLANARKALIRRLLSPTQRNDAIEELYHRRMIQFLEIMKSPDISDQVVLSGAEAMRIINNAAIDQKFFFRNRCYTRGRGIPQGNPLSTRLSNLYLGAMERERYPDILRRRDCLFLRYADDYLLLTADIDVANRFLKGILCVQQDSDRDVYGIKGALNKTTINFDADLSDDLKSQISVIDEHGCISIDLSKIEKYRAFKRFWNGSVVGSHKKRLDILNYIRGPVLRK
ncbi:unnamed protein product [Anisakis simplex]|uniref:Telomerase reverse transcriptase n=1 Tax=Anisakis simplex TaxID=6269 RepID=A0A3P6RNA0_ANISI|nr:unnamed protein product [Anisakis simplex]